MSTATLTGRWVIRDHNGRGTYTAHFYADGAKHRTMLCGQRLDRTTDAFASSRQCGTCLNIIRKSESNTTVQEPAVNVATTATKSTRKPRAAKAVVADAAEAAADVVAAARTAKPRARKAVEPAAPRNSAEQHRLADAAIKSARTAIAAARKLESVTDSAPRIASAYAKANKAIETALARIAEAGTEAPADMAVVAPQSPVALAPFDQKSLDMVRTVKTASALLDALATGEGISGFSAGNVEGSASDRSLLVADTREVANVATKAASAAVTYLTNRGILAREDATMTITESGARILAKVAVDLEQAEAPAATAPQQPAPAPEAPAKAAPKARATKAAGKPATAPAKAAKPVAEPKARPAADTKAQALAAAAREAGWDTDVTVDGTSVVVVSSREGEVLTTTFANNSLDSTRMPRYQRADGSVVLLRNVSAVKKQMDADPAARPVKATKSAPRARRVEGAERPQKSVPFDIATVDADTLATLIVGKTLRWRRSLDGSVDEALVLAIGDVKQHPIKTTVRIVDFIEGVVSKRGLVAGPQRTLALDAILSVG